MGDIDVSKVVATTQEYDAKTGEMVTKVTHVGPAVTDKKVGDVISRVKADPPASPEAEKKEDSEAAAKLKKLQDKLVEKGIMTEEEVKNL